MRICSLLPGATEIAFALGLGNNIVGVSHECDYPPEARNKPIMVKSAIDLQSTSSKDIDSIISNHALAGKNLYQIDLDRLKEANPDIVLTQELCGVCAIDLQEIKKAISLLPQKPKNISLTPSSLDDIFRDIQRVGEATCKHQEAESLTTRLKKQIVNLKEKSSRSGHRPRVACIEWLDPLYAAGHWVPEMVELAGGTNVLANHCEPSKKIDCSTLFKSNPEILILMPCGFDLERTLCEAARLNMIPEFETLSAINKFQIFAVDGNSYFNRPGPRLIDGIDILAQIIHPEIFPWTTLPTAAVKLN